MRLPWYVTAWRSLWLVPLLAAASLLALVVLVGWGPREARDVWADLS